MNFLNVEVFWLLPFILVAMILAFWWASVRRRKLLKSILGARAEDPDQVLVNYPRRNLRFFILCLTALFLVTAAARPWWSMSIVPYEAKGRDLMVLFDVSKSMLAEDIKPSRLEHAKWLVHQLTEQAAGNRFGLIAFAGEAFLECPLTRDMSSFNLYLDELNTDSIPLPGTNMQRALETAVQAFKSAEGDNRAIILITDGEELEGDSSRVISELKSRNIPLFIIGIGDPASPAVIPNYEKGVKANGFKRDASGELVKTVFNETQLLKLQKEIPGSIYIRSTTTNPGLEPLLAKIEALVPADLDSGTRTRPIERFHYFIIGALALLALYLGLSERRSLNGRRTGALLVILSALALPLQAQDDKGAADNSFLPRPQPVQTPPEGEKTEAIPAGLDSISLYNLGRETQLEKKEGAEQLYEKSINSASENPLVRGRAFHNLAVLLHEKARSQMAEANSKLEQNLDAADQAFSASQQALGQAEELYLRAMTETASDDGTDANFAVNQQLLLRDHKITEDIKNDIKEYKEKHGEAIKGLEEAVSAASELRPDKSVQAGKTVKRLQELSGKLRQQQMAQDSDAAGKEIEQALNVIASDEPQAIKHLEKALEILKKKDDQNKDQNKDQQDQKDQKDQQNQDQKDQKDQNKDQKDQKDQNKDQQDKDQKDQDKDKQDQQDKDQKDQDKDQKDQDQKQGEQPRPEERKIDPEQAKKMLELMAKDEKNLRDALKAKRMEGMKNIKVDKDW